MVNFVSKLLGNAVSGMTVQQALLGNAANNIANVNTPGYTRRDIDLQNRADTVVVDGVLRIGSGVQLGEVRRITNEFLESSLRVANSQQGQADVRNEFLGRIENIFNLSGPQMNIGGTLNDFFSAVNQVGVDPSNLALRLNVQQKGEDLISTIKSSFQNIADAQTELDQKLYQEVSAVNSISKQLADLNGAISQSEYAGVPAIDERDQRDVLLSKLAQKVSFKTLDLPNGMTNCYLDNGFPLVTETTARELSVTTSPSFASGTLPPSLGGGILGYVVYNFGSDTQPSHLDLTKLLKAGQGSIGGILQLRGYADPSNTSAYEADGEMVQMASKIEAVTRMLLTTANQVYRGDDENSGTAAFEPSSADLNGNFPAVFGLFDFDYSGTKDADGDGLATTSDLLASGMDSFSNRLKLGFTLPEEFAAARDADPTPGTTAFTLGDGSNAQALASLRTQALTFSAGSFAFTGTADELYNSAVSTIGNLKAAAQNDYDAATNNFNTASAKRDEFSAVSLDEEFANVIKYQKAFQASARMIKTAADMLDTIASLV